MNCITGNDVRPCDIDPEILLAGCNPDCANGGTCVNGTCICPIGITGKACNEGKDSLFIKLTVFLTIVEIVYVENIGHNLLFD